MRGIQGPTWSWYFKQYEDAADSVCATCDKFHAALTLVNTQDCLTVGSCPGTVAVIFILFFLAHGHLNYGNEGHSRGMS